MVHNVACDEWCGKPLPSEPDQIFPSPGPSHSTLLGQGTDESDAVKADWLSPLPIASFPWCFGGII